MFKAIRASDRASLRTFAKAFDKKGNYPATLLCLDHFFSSPLKLRNRSMDEVHASLCLFFDYIFLLNKLRRDESLAKGSARRRLFGFQMLGPNRYLVPEHNHLYRKVGSGSLSGKKSAGGRKCSSSELSRCINDVIRTRTLQRTEDQNATCREVHGFSPCSRLLVQGGCYSSGRTGTCTFQHIEPDQLTADWYRDRLDLILLQLQILDSAGYDETDVKKYVLAHSAKNPCGAH